MDITFFVTYIVALGIMFFIAGRSYTLMQVSERVNKVSPLIMHYMFLFAIVSSVILGARIILASVCQAYDLPVMPVMHVMWVMLVSCHLLFMHLLWKRYIDIPWFVFLLFSGLVTMCVALLAAFHNTVSLFFIWGFPMFLVSAGGLLHVSYLYCKKNINGITLTVMISLFFLTVAIGLAAFTLHSYPYLKYIARFSYLASWFPWLLFVLKRGVDGSK